MTLAIRPDGALDFLSLGALVHRLDPGIVPFRKAAHCDIHVSGGEYNVAANLADCFGLRTGIASAMVDYPVGDLIAERVRAMGVHPFYKRFAHNGVNGPNMATVYSDRGAGVRPPVVFYNRAHEAAAQLAPGDFDWKAIFGAGVRWFHSGGIFAALSSTTGPLIVEAMQAAKAAGAITSFDFNFREKLWSLWGGEKVAAGVMEQIIAHVDVLIGGEEDLHRLGFSAPPSAVRPELDPGRFLEMVQKVVARYPHVKAAASTLRKVHSANRHSWSAVAWSGGKAHLAPIFEELDVVDRVGSGDGFAAGFIYGLLSGATTEEAVKLGWAHGALLMTFPGDTTMATLAEVRALATGGSARIQR